MLANVLIFAIKLSEPSLFAYWCLVHITLAKKMLALCVWTNFPAAKYVLNNALRKFVIMRIEPVFILETQKQTKYCTKCLPKFIQTDNAFLV